jgi:hypothetical protein
VSAPLRVNKGELLGYRVFDVGAEIDLDAAETACASMTPRRAAISVDPPELFSLAHPPLVVDVGVRTVQLKTVAMPLEVRLSARLFDYGAVSVQIAFAIAADTALGDLLPLCDELYESIAIEKLARVEVDKLTAKLGKALQGRHDWRGAESYTVIFLTELGDGRTAQDLLAWEPLAKLLIGEPRDKRLSQEETRDVLKHAHSYFEDDLAVIDWNSAVVLEPSGSRAIPEILEFATSQLLELRYYDGVFDRELARIYDDLAEAHRGPLKLLRDPYARLGKAVLRRLVELTEFTERVDNALKIIGDVYLARVYQSAVRRFRIPAWQTSINEKQLLVAQAYGFIRGEIEARRSITLEVIVILLILAELVNALRSGH